ncbi:MAG: alpha amylase N-terminal ig-like domain-containing protein [Clostridia bacterium]|nr:alpha amylase N-terminal ig-like domain-containing protein [Clostridia bacterium]
MKKRLMLILALLMIISTALFTASCATSYGYKYGGWNYEGAIDMTNGEKLTDKKYENTKEYAMLQNPYMTDYAPTVSYRDEYIGSVKVSALFHDQSEVFLKGGKTSHDEVTVIFRTAKGNVSDVTLLLRGYTDKSHTEHKMSVSSSDSYFDYYSVTLPASSLKRYYSFKITANGEMLYYTAALASKELPSVPASNWFILTPDFNTPEWSQGTVWYSIFPDSFFNGDTLNDAGDGSYTGAISRIWGTSRTGYLYPTVSAITGKDYYGGDLSGIFAKIGYLKDTLGVESIYTNPIFEATFNVGYGPDDFLTVSRYYGTNAELAELISVLHDNGMKFITDGVWLYSGQNSKEYNKNGYWPEKGAFQGSDTAFKDFYFLPKNKQWPNVQTVYNENVFKINFETDFTKDYIGRSKNSALLYFLGAPYNMDGWRLDVPAYNKSSSNGFEVEEMFRSHMDLVNPDAVLIGETTVLPEERHGTALDSVWNYGDFAEHIYLYFDAPRNHPGDESVNYKTTVSYDGSEMLKKVATSVNKVPFAVSKSGYNLISSHDVARVLTNLENDEDRAILAAVMQFTMVGSPVIYYGDEIGMTGHSASFGNMQSFDWNEKNWNYKIFNSYKSLLNLRKDFDNVLSHGGFMPLTAVSEPDVLSYARFTDDEAVITAINNGSKRENIEIPVYKLGLYNDGDILQNYQTGERYCVKNGVITVSVGSAQSAIIVKSEKRGGSIGKYISADIGSVPVLGSAVFGEDNVTLTGSGYLENVNDSFRLLAEKIFGAAEISVSTSANGAGVMIRESESIYSPFVSLSIENGKAVMKTREAEGGNVTEIASSAVTSEKAVLKLERSAENLFTAYLFDGNGMQKVGEISVAMKEGALAGIFVAGGNECVTAEFTDFTVKEIATPVYDKFEGTVPAAIYARLPKSCSVSKGALTLFTEGKTARMLSAFSSNDFSVTVKLKETDGKAGLTVYQDEKNNISVLFENGKLTLNSTLSGFSVTEAQVDLTDSEIYLHLQKAGLYLSAYYSTDNENYKQLGGFINANFSELYGGMIAIGGSKAVFESFTAGDMINGKNALITNKDNTDISFDYASNSGHKISYGEGAWQYTDAGFAQTSQKGYSNCDYISYPAGDRHIFDVTLNITGGTGGAGISFGKKEITQKATESGYYLEIKANGDISLYRDGEKIASASEKVKADDKNRVRIIADKQTGIAVYINDNKNAVITAEISEKKLYGSLSLITDNASAEFRNVSQRSYLCGFESYSMLGFYSENGTVKTNITDYGLICGPSGRVFDDVTIKASFSIMSIKENGYVGLLLRAKTGEYPENSGALVYFKEGKVGISFLGETVAEREYDVGAGKRLKPEISVIGSEITVKLDGNTVISATVEAMMSSGAAEFIATYATASLYDFEIK